MRAARNVLETLPTENAVPATTGTCRLTSAQPFTPIQLRPSGQMIVTDTPGTWYCTRRAFRRAWSAEAGIVVGIGVGVGAGVVVGFVVGTGDAL